MSNIKFNKEQLEAINHKEGACAVIAGAGSGKSTVLVNRIKKLVDDGVCEEKIVAITFTDNSSKDLKNKLKKLGMNNVVVGTFHSICRKILAKEGIDTGKMLKSFEIENEFRKISKKPKMNDIMSFISYQKNYGIGANDEFIEKDSDYCEEDLRRFYNAYEKLKKNLGAMDFDDWLLKARDILRYTYNSKKYTCDYILVDEHQDSNLIQNDIIDLLCPSKNIMVVGDYRQCLLPNTRIKTINGEKLIKDITTEDELVVGSGRGTITTIKPDEIMTREYNGNILEITTKNGNKIECTPNHVIFTNRRINKPYYVYIMYKPEYGFRIGQSSKYSEVNGFEKRLTDEGAERVWCIGTYDTSREACYYENYFAFKYGIPLYVFKEKGRKIGLKQCDIKKLFKDIDTYSRGYKLLKDNGLYFDYPHYRPKGNSKYVGVNISFTMFGSSRKQKGILNKYNGYNHELAYNTIDKSFYDETSNLLGSCVAKRQNGVGFKYYMARKSNGNHDELFKLGCELSNIGENTVFSQRAIMTKSLTKMELFPAANIMPGMEVAILLDGELVNDEVVSVKKRNYKGKVYDINIPKYRNYIANNIAVHNCIYGFRGSEPSLFMNFASKYQDSKVINLDINYRSSSRIVEGANRFIRKYYSDYKFYSDSKSSSKEAGIVDILNFNSKQDEAEKIVECIKNDLDNGVNPNEIAVLYRMNQHSFEIENELKKNKISYHTSAKNSFFNRREINAIICILRLIDNPDDDGAFEEVFNFRCYPVSYISKQIFGNIVDLSARKNISLFEACEVSKTNKDWERRSLDNFRKIILSLVLQNKRCLPLIKIIDNIITLFRFEEYIEDRYSGDELDERLASLESLKLFVRDNTVKSLLKFVYSSNKTERKNNKNDIQLMTVHKSKGLEFKKTYVVGIEDEKFPHINSNEIDEARLFYVAITRAEQHLVISQIYEGNQFVDEYING